MSRQYNGANVAKGAGVAGATRVALYVRVSTDEQKRHGFSLADQGRTLRQHAEREGFVVAEEVADEGLSGANPYRPGLGRVLELAQEGAIGSFATSTFGVGSSATSPGTASGSWRWTTSTTA